MASGHPPDYEALFRQEQQRRRQAEERVQLTTFDEYIENCHVLLSVPLRVGKPSRSTKGNIPPPTRKYCPTRFRAWSDFEEQQVKVFSIVRRYLEPTHDERRQFTSLLVLEDLSRRVSGRSISSEKDLEVYACRTVEEHVQDIVRALCRLPEARAKLQLDDGIRFDNHANDFDEDEDEDEEQGQVADTPVGRPDQFCIHRHGEENSLLMTVEYKPPHKLSIETLCAGLRPMDFWREAVNVQTVPTDENEKLAYNAIQLAGSAVVQEYHVMIQEGLTYSYLYTGEALVFLNVPESDPSTLRYHLCVPNKDIEASGPNGFLKPMTAIARVLCLCLMSCQHPLRSNVWRNATSKNLHTWASSFVSVLDQISDEELKKTPPGSEYIPSSPLSSSPAPAPERLTRRTETHCTPAPTTHQDLTDSSDSDLPPATSERRHNRKRKTSDMTSSPPSSRLPPSQRNAPTRESRQRKATAAFCTQKCLLGLQRGGALDHSCPNVAEHRHGQDTVDHLINAPRVVQLLEQQLSQDPDHLCAPHGEHGAYAAPFKITLASYGYTMIGKGTTSKRWKEVSCEAVIYKHLYLVQGSVVPVFLGNINLAQPYFLHATGSIQHFLLMAWGGKTLSFEEMSTRRKEISRCKAKIQGLGVLHGDWRSHNLLWNEELRRVLAIDFHRSQISLEHPRIESLKRNGASETSGSPTKRQQLSIASV